MVAGLFTKTGISIYPSGRDDHLIDIKGLDSSVLPLEEWYLAPENRHNSMEEALAALDDVDEFLDAREALGLPRNNYRIRINKKLKELCRERGLRVGGNKSHMMKRLEDDDMAKITSKFH
ncbi:hypothetical protein GGR50DRAFT_698787 [Xylaria sp. CBS 124048]|nr:hypothetical protein GGR50DRAFT_698787 [Xylaria sp. CBS 124048]